LLIAFFFSIYFCVGEVELENLPLKKDALSHFGLPIKAYSGSIGKIKLQIPVRQFRSAPWCINIEKVFIVCGPVNLDDVSCERNQLKKLLTFQQFFLVGPQCGRAIRFALQASIS
jgi:vacuolar protein sorting-associated protein 13D